MDDAALHHVFDQGWMWVLRFGNGVTSAGIAVTESLATELRLADGAPAWERFLARYPSIAAQFADAKPIREFTWMPRVAYRAVAGRGRAMGDAAVGGGVHRSVVLDRDSVDVAGNRTYRARRIATLGTRGLKPALYGEVSLAEADHTARFVAGCYAAFPRFDAFTAYRCSTSPPRASARCSGASRLSVPLAASSARQMSRTVSAMRDLSPAENPSVADFFARVTDATAPVNVAGLCNPALRNWYPVDLEDTVRAAHKFGLTPGRVRDALEFANVASTPNVSDNRGDRSPDVSSGTRLGR